MSAFSSVIFFILVVGFEGDLYYSSTMSLMKSWKYWHRVIILLFSKYYKLIFVFEYLQWQKYKISSVFDKENEIIHLN